MRRQQIFSASRAASARKCSYRRFCSIESRRHSPQAGLLDQLVQPLVIQAAAHRKKRLAEFAGMWGAFVLLKSGLPAPYLDQRQMIGPAALLQYVVAQHAGILRAVDAQLPDSGKALILFRANEIDVRQDIHGACAGYLGLADHKAGVQALINWRCKIGLKLVMRLRRTRRRSVARLRLCVAPDFQDGELLRPPDTLENFKAAVSRLL